MHLAEIWLLIVFGSAALSVLLIFLRWRQWWTPSLPLSNIEELRLEQSKLRLVETFLSREMLHPYLGYVFNPAAEDADWAAAGVPKQPVNSFGILAETSELPRKMAGKLSIAFLGGSVAQFLSYDNQDALLAAFRDAIGPDGPAPQVHCLAVPGYKQPQQLAALTYFYSLGAEFDIVINLDGFNEVALHPAENYFKGVCFSFPRAWAARSAARIDPAQIFLFGQLAVIQQSRQKLWDFLNRPLARYIPQLYYALALYEARLRSNRNRVMKSIRQFKPVVDQNLNAALRNDPVDYQQLVDLWSRSSRLIYELCQANGARYFQFLQPNQYVPDSKPLTAEEQEKAFDPEHPYRPGVIAGYPLLRKAAEALRQHGVGFIDISMTFADCNETVYMDRCCHFNRRGNEMLSSAIAQAIFSSPVREGVLASAGSARSNEEKEW